MILGYIKVSVPKYALSFFELALAFYSEIIFLAIALRPTDKLRIALQTTVDCIRYSRS